MTAAALEGFTGIDAMPYQEVKGPLGTVKQIARSGIPFGVANAIEGQGPLAVGLSLAGARPSPPPAIDQFDIIAKQKFGGKKFQELERWQQKEIEKQNPDVYHTLIANSRPMQQQAELQRQKIYNEQLASDERFQSCEVTYDQWKSEMNKRRDQERAVMNFIYRDQVSQKDNPLTRYFEIINSEQQSDGTVNWDNVDAKVSALPPDDQAYVSRNTGLDGTPMVLRYQQMKKQAAPFMKEYMDMPTFLGASVEESQDTTNLLQSARAIQGQTMGKMPMQAAIVMAAKQLGTDRKIIGIAMTAEQRRNPRKSMYWKQHPALGQLYGSMAPKELMG